MRLWRSEVREVVLAVIWGGLLSAAQKSWTLDAIMDLKTVSDPQITADGSKVAYVVTRKGRDAGMLIRRRFGLWRQWEVRGDAWPSRIFPMVTRAGLVMAAPWGFFRIGTGGRRYTW